MARFEPWALDSPVQYPGKRLIMLPLIVLVKSLHSEIARETFSQQALEEGAQAILSAGGLVYPLIVEREGAGFEFRVLDGHFAYWAAVRAREINPRAGEKVNVWLAEEPTQQGIQAQVRIFSQPAPVSAATPEPNPEPIAPGPVATPKPVAPEPVATAKAKKPETVSAPVLEIQADSVDWRMPASSAPKSKRAQKEQLAQQMEALALYLSPPTSPLQERLQEQAQQLNPNYRKACARLRSQIVGELYRLSRK